MAFIIYAAPVLTRFDRLLLIRPSATPNLCKLAACVVPARGFTVRGIPMGFSNTLQLFCLEVANHIDFAVFLFKKS